MTGRIPVIVATNAFGMGIDKRRNGEPARAILFYRPEDLNIHKFFAGGMKLGAEKVERVAEALAKKEEPVTAKELAEETDLSKAKVEKALRHLEQAGAVAATETGELVLTEESANARTVAEHAA